MFRLFLLLTFGSAVFGGFSNLQTTFYDGIPKNNIGVTENGNELVEIGAKFYIIEAESKVSWFDAAHICRRLNGHLASIESEVDMTALSDYLFAKGYGQDKWFWLSGHDLGAEGKFFWQGTGNPITTQRWSPGQPDNAGGNENCVHLWKHGNGYRMNDWICTQQAHYICEANAPKTISFTVW